MATRRTGMTRRAALAGMGGLAAGATATRGAAQQPMPLAHFEQDIPIRGKAGPGLEPFDPAMLKIMERHGVPGAALAIALNGKLVLAKAYGWASLTPTPTPAQPDDLFGLASLSKAITAVATLKLVEQGKLGLDDKVFDILKQIKPPAGHRVAPNLPDVTVRQCLNHSGGWDRAASGDPVTWEPQICRALRIRPPLTPARFVSFMLSVTANFKPGTDAKYSNVGYIILGEVIAKVSGQTYEKYVADHILKPMGITRLKLHPYDNKYLAREAHRHLAGSFIALPPLQMPMVDAAGGWTGSVVDVLRFLTNLDGSRGQSVLTEKTRKLMTEPPPEPIKPRPDGTYYGLGWDSVIVQGKLIGYYKDGSSQGMRTFMKRLPNGVNWALLYNASMEFDPQDMQLAAGTVHEVRRLIEGHGKFPDHDLFADYA